METFAEDLGTVFEKDDSLRAASNASAKAAPNGTIKTPPGPPMTSVPPGPPNTPPPPLKINLGATATVGKADLSFPSPLTTPMLVKESFMSFPSPATYGEGKYDFKSFLNDLPTPVLPTTPSTTFATLGMNQINEIKMENSQVPPPPPSISPSASTKPRKRTSRRRASTSSVPTRGSKAESRWKSWSREEEIFLVGAVMDRFFKRGSLSSTRADDNGTDDCWSYIKAKYDTAWKNYEARTGKSAPPERSMNALSRHYKVMKARISQADMEGEENSDDFRTFFLMNGSKCTTLKAVLLEQHGTTHQVLNTGNAKYDFLTTTTFAVHGMVQEELVCLVHVP
eukprot:CAMPEP_0204824936 /NCGR_PEP_ID=MMETSP1346-20131115/2913_1 /ASSEMBLY_ACC=CAM_ASM_000771 /TAXON_ID=215587 /ORGANISM="Aplanochytrium stocchinoi, Strain GSBS06" /LENGTH=338 /DNA_ID=CAMNT_0051952373 /DNA_START=412 /DNA_END=1428 /DNA_ORIENTATION=+